MSSPTKPFAQLAVTKTRTRGDTTSLLPTSFDPNDDDMPACPVPEVRPSLYTPERLKQSLEYAHRFLERRNISPRTELFMYLFKEEVKDALTTEIAEERELNITMIMAEERLIQTKQFLRPLQSIQDAVLQERLLELRELQYYTRYGDYLKIIPARLRQAASDNKLENWQMISGPIFWSDIAEKLEKEQDARAEATRKGSVLDSVERETTIAISVACSNIGIDEKLAVWSIMKYGARNLQVHRDLVDLRKAGKFPQLAKTLYADREELTFTFSEFKSDTDISSLRTIIQSEIDKWFDSSRTPNHPEGWKPTEALYKAHEDAITAANQPSKAEQKQNNIAKAKQLSEDKAARQREAGKAGSAGSAIASKKRMASTEEPRGSEPQRHKRTTQQRFKLLATKCKLEMEMEHINRQLGILNEDDDDLQDVPPSNDD